MDGLQVGCDAGVDADALRAAQRTIVLCLASASFGLLSRQEVERSLGGDPFAIESALSSLAEDGVIEVHPERRLIGIGPALRRLDALGLVVV